MMKRRVPHPLVPDAMTPYPISPRYSGRPVQGPALAAVSTALLVLVVLAACPLPGFSQGTEPPGALIGAPTPNTLFRYSVPLQSAAGALPDGVFTGPRSTLLNQDLNALEQKTYGRTYADQSVQTRIKRLEQSLLGVAQPGKLQDRLSRLSSLVSHQNQAKEAGDQMKMVDYLEQRLFQMNYGDEPVENRVARLETHTFGRSNPTQPWEDRLERLTYTIPLMAKGVKLSRTGTVIATTREATPRPGRETRREAPMLTPIDVSASGVVMSAKRLAPDGSAISVGDYFHNINKPASNQLLRWNDLPVNVFVQGGDAEESDILTQAIAAWRRTFPVSLVTTQQEADIIASWSGESPPDGILVRPVTRLGQGPAGAQVIRTVLLVNLSMARPLQGEYRMHLLQHLLGHALGLWGHSDDPQDVMYPVLAQEQVDIPPKWLRRSYVPMVSRRNVTVPVNPLPTARDSATLTKVYDAPALDLSQLSMP
ncbi:MAG: hypothetical protein AB7P76_08010 [Candidatus Melainabacteria bacterium]